MIDERRKLIERQFRRIFLSAQRECPSDDAIYLLVEDAIRLWRDIPSEKLVQAVEDAIIEAGSFPATSGLVAKLWKEKRSRPIEYASPLRIESVNTEDMVIDSPTYTSEYWARVFHGKFNGKQY